MFISEEIGWYKDPKFLASAEQFYSNSDEYAPNKDGKRLDELRMNADDVFGVGSASINEDHYAIREFRCEHVRRHLKKFFDKMMPKTISHGDFNTNNII